MSRVLGRAPSPPSIVEIQALCQRVRLAGAPGAPARAALVGEYERLARGLGVAPAPVPTGAALQQAAVALLRQASAARRALDAARLASEGGRTSRRAAG